MAFVPGGEWKAKLLSFSIEGQALSSDSAQNGEVGIELSCQETGAGRERTLELCILPLHSLRAP